MTNLGNFGLFAFTKFKFKDKMDISFVKKLVSIKNDFSIGFQDSHLTANNA